MTKNDIISNLYKTNAVKNILNKYSLETHENLSDLEQDIYLILLQIPEDILLDMYDKKKLSHWLTATIKNQIYSTTSNYYIQYKKFKNLSDEIEED